MWNVRLGESQAGVKTARRKINNHLQICRWQHRNGRKWRRTKDPLDESERGEESENTGLKLNIQKMKIMAFGPTISWQIDGENFETVTDFNVTDHNEGWVLKNWYFQTVIVGKTLESPLNTKRLKQSVLKQSTLNIHWKDWCWSWGSNILATWAWYTILDGMGKSWAQLRDWPTTITNT